MNRIRYSMFIVALMLALILSAFNVAPAFADEATPPAETQEVVEETESTTPEEEAITPPADEETDSASESESPSVAEIIETLPEDTTLVVVDENGEALPLASEEAAEVIEGADPRWCPVGVTPGGAGCSPSFFYFTGAGGLIEWLTDPLNDAAVSKAGVIWIESAYDSTLETDAVIVLNGNDFVGPGTNMDDFALTINGGWAGGASKVLNPNDPSVFDLSFSIINWTGAVTINNIVIDSATTGNYALEVLTAGNITLNNVDVQNNTTTFGGANLDNGSGVGNVIVNDSTFNNNNSGRGIQIISNGTVTLKNVTANGNFNDGAFIDNTSATTPKAVTLNGTNHFSYNAAGGLEILTKGVITINNITAMGNTEGHGAYLNNCAFDYLNLDCDYGVASGVTIKGTNNFSDNGWDGLRVWSGGAITVSNITANGNGTSGTRDGATAVPDNFDATGKGAFLHNFGSLTPKAITLTGTNTFNDNASNGLYADSWGKVTVSNLTANFNGCDFAFELGTGEYCAGAYLSAQGGVTQTGYGRFEGNGAPDGAPGLFVFSINKGAVLLNNLYADSNQGTGVTIVGGGAPPINVTINGINTFTSNAGDGLYIDTDGTVTLNNLKANYNFLTGAYISNEFALTSKAVIIKGAAVFNGNDIAGLVVYSNGAVTTAGITAIANGGDGVFIENCLTDGLDGCDATSALPVTLNGNNFIEGNNSLNNGFFGLLVFSRGLITVNNLSANYGLNDAGGAFLMNQFTNAVAGITLKGFVTTSFNEGVGLDILSHGAITLANLTANSNGLSGLNGYGITIDNATNSTKPMNVTITGTNQANSNFEDGMSIYSYGTVLISNLTANYNGNSSVHDGLKIDNGSGTLARPVTLLGTNMFNDNFGYGLDIFSLGAITVNNVMASYNGQNGASLDNNNNPLISQPVTIKGYGIFNNNGIAHTGLFVESNGNVTLANISASGNGDYGAYIYTENNVKPANFANVTITGVNTFNDNGLNGLFIQNDGLITISNITANNNDDIGVSLDNANLASGGLRNVTISGVNMFNGNEGDGLYISASGTVTLTRITANFNNNLGDGSGVTVFTTNGAINLTCGSMYNNADYGYDLNAGGGKAITIKGVFTFGNPLGNNAPAAIITRTCPLP